MIEAKQYHAKVLLFGEYSVIYGSKGLSVPFNIYAGCFAKNKHDQLSGNALESNKSLSEFQTYLADLKAKNELVVDINLDLLKMEIQEGLYFDSSIPQGSGVGSSGALCAAIYDQFSRAKIVLNEQNWNDQITKLREAFVQMESHFHGTSSGLDPLNCYLHKPLYILDKTEIRPVKLKTPSGLGIFLLDTGHTGKTQPLVNLFFDNLRNYSYYKKFNYGFLPANNNCIDTYLEGVSDSFYDHATSLSSLTFDLFKPMIPEAFHKIWHQGLQSREFILKLCGSGGGGFLLGFTKNPEFAYKTLADTGYMIIPWQES